jgi:ribose transport system permease protein
VNKLSVFRARTGGGIFEKYTLILVWLLLIVIFSLMMPDKFMTWQNVTTMLGSKAILVVLSLAIMIPLIAGDYDMSVAAVMTLSSMITAVLNIWFHWPIALAIFVAIVIVIAVGVCNGALCSFFEMDPFIVTMGVQTLLQGVILGISSNTVTGVDQVLKQAVYLGRIGGIPYVFFYALITCILLYYFFEKTSAGKKILITGRGRNVAKLSGIKTGRVRTFCFMASGGLAAFAGVLYTGMMGGANPSSGMTYLMPAFAGVFLGSTCIKPGRFNPWGCLIAIYFLVTGTTGLSLMGIQGFIQDIFYGAALVLSVLFTSVVKRSQDKKTLKALAQLPVSADSAVHPAEERIEPKDKDIEKTESGK